MVRPCIFSTAKALQRVFLQTPEPQWQLLVLRPRLSTPSPKPETTVQIRGLGTGRPYETSAVLKRLGNRQRDHQIEARYVHIQEPDKGTLSEPQLTSLVLQRLDLARYSLVVIAMPGAREVSEDRLDVQPQYPVCKIMDKWRISEEMAKKEAEERRKAVGTKEIEIRWNISSHDLETRLRKLKEFLEKGLKVEVTLTFKKGKRAKTASIQQERAVLEAVEQAAGNVPDVSEYRRREGQVGQTMTIFWQSAALAAQREAERKALQTEKEKKKEEKKEEKREAKRRKKAERMKEIDSTVNPSEGF